MNKKLISIPDFARAAGISEGLARELVRNGKVPTIIVGTRHKIDSEWVAGWLSSVKPNPSTGTRLLTAQ
jgi:hypothetical protein